MSSLNDFIASIKTEGLMRNNRFAIQFSVPATVNQTFDLQKVMLYCDSVNLPSVTVETAQARTFGEFKEMPYNRLFDNITMGFYVDNGMQVKLLFDQWINSIQDPDTRVMNYYRNYTTDITIDVYDIAEENRYQVTLYEAYPKMISPIQMDYGNKDIMKLTVSMNYKYWKSSAMESSGISASSVQENPALDTLFKNNGLLGQSLSVPDSYFTNFPAFQAGFNSFENSRAALFAAELQGATQGLASSLPSPKLSGFFRS